MEELTAFYNYIKAIFPMHPYNHDYNNVKEVIRQFQQDGVTYSFCEVPGIREKTDLVQGDVLSELPFKYYNEKGEEKVLKAKSMIISNSCDIENDDRILLAPAIDIHEISSENEALAQSIRANMKTAFLYIPDNGILKDYAIDFSWISMFPKQLIMQFLKDEKIYKIITLNQLGYYMLLCKLAVHFMRPESNEVQRLA